MRIFNFRYLLIAAAMLAVWLMGRSRAVQPASDASWTPITGDMVSTDVPGTIGECQQNGACTDTIGSAVESTTPTMTDPLPVHQVMLGQMTATADLDGLEGTDEMGDTGAFVESEFVRGSVAIDESTLVEPVLIEPVTEIESTLHEVASMVEESASAVPAKVSDMSASFAKLETAGDTEPFDTVAGVEQAELGIESRSGLADVRAQNGSKGESVGPANRIGNRFMNDAEEQSETEAPSEPWTKNPFVTESVDRSFNAEEVVPAQLTRASLEQTSISVLETERATQASHPKPDLSQMNYVRNDIAPVNNTLPEGVAQEAVHHIEYGKSLSRRGASFGARQKFFAALGVIARGNDVQTGGNAYTTALGRAIRALREVQDFAVRDAEIHVGNNVAEILETHQTRIIGGREAMVMTPVEAMQRYFTFAHQQLSFAGGQNVVTAEALYCLGKLHTVMAKHQPETLDIAKAIVFHRAAVSSDAGNSRSYNELGVLLARSGQLGEAEELFKMSLQINPLAETWQNLAKTHGRQGEAELAQLAQTEFAIATQTTPFQPSAAQIAWLPSQAFNQVGPADFHDSKATISGAVVPASRTTAVEEDVEKKGSFKKAITERFNLKNWF